MNYTGNGTAYTKFSLAVDTGKDQAPMWLNVVCWQDLAEKMTGLLYKGALVFVEGKLQLRTYPARNGGGEKMAVDIVASNIQLLSARKATSSEELEPDGKAAAEITRSWAWIMKQGI